MERGREGESIEMQGRISYAWPARTGAAPATAPSPPRRPPRRRGSQPRPPPRPPARPPPRRPRTAPRHPRRTPPAAPGPAARRRRPAAGRARCARRRRCAAPARPHSPDASAAGEASARPGAALERGGGGGADRADGPKDRNSDAATAAAQRVRASLRRTCWTHLSSPMHPRLPVLAYTDAPSGTPAPRAPPGNRLWSARLPIHPPARPRAHSLSLTDTLAHPRTGARSLQARGDGCKYRHAVRTAA
jgi:hypothetical protein